jgi:hypothetical protein
VQSQLEDLQHKMGSSLSDRYTSQQKATAKIMADYENMRRDLLKVGDLDDNNNNNNNYIRQHLLVFFISSGSSNNVLKM